MYVSVYHAGREVYELFCARVDAWKRQKKPFVYVSILLCVTENRACVRARGVHVRVCVPACVRA